MLEHGRRTETVDVRVKRALAHFIAVTRGAVSDRRIRHPDARPTGPAVDPHGFRVVRSNSRPGRARRLPDTASTCVRSRTHATSSRCAGSGPVGNLRGEKPHAVSCQKAGSSESHGLCAADDLTREITMQCVHRAPRQGIVGQEQPAEDFDVGVTAVVQHRQQTGQPLDDLPSSPKNTSGTPRTPCRLTAMIL